MARNLVWPDSHLPFHHPKSRYHLLKTRDKYKCTRVTNVGDLADFAAYSMKWPMDPNGFSPGQEYELVMESLQEFYKEFDQVDVVLGNHDLRPYKKLFNSQLPKQLVKSVSEFFHSPKGWIWHETGIEIDSVYYFHGEGLSQSNWRLAHEKYKTSVCHGHLHNSAGAVYHQDRKKRYFVLNAGCLIDEKAYCFRYSQYNFNKAVLGCGVILDGETAIFEPMPSKWL